MRVLTRRTFFGLVAGSAAAAALPRRVLGMAVEPAGDVILGFQERMDKMMTLVETYIQYHGTQYLHMRFLSDSGTVLSEDVRPLRPHEEFTLMRIGGTSKP